MFRKVRKDPIPHFRPSDSSTSQVRDMSGSTSKLLAKGCSQGGVGNDPDDSSFRAAATFSINNRIIGNSHKHQI
jgi:hypothetical protein